jgi:hypothetical protein
MSPLHPPATRYQYFMPAAVVHIPVIASDLSIESSVELLRIRDETLLVESGRGLAMVLVVMVRGKKREDVRVAWRRGAVSEVKRL